MDYLIEYYGSGGMQECITFHGDAASLAECITWIEESGGQSLTVTQSEDGHVVYEEGGFVVNTASVAIEAMETLGPIRTDIRVGDKSLSGTCCSDIPSDKRG